MAHKRVNDPPESGIRVPAVEMSGLVAALFGKVGTSREDAVFMGEVLSQNDLRCVFSHGTRQTARYVREMLDGNVNPRPEIRTVNESPGSLVLDGDGGLGYFPCYQGTERAIDKAKTCGVAALTTRNHFHFGAAGIYTRMALAQDCIGLSISACRGEIDTQRVVAGAVGSPPVSVAIPAGAEPPLVMDMSSNVAWFTEELFARMPVVIFKSMALAGVVRALGGEFAGIHKEEFKQPQSRWVSNQGSFILVIDVSHFMPVDELKQHMDRFIGTARQCRPLPGLDRAELAGGLEWQWERENRVAGIPVGDDHRQVLQEIADELGVETPFVGYEDTQF